MEILNWLDDHSRYLLSCTVHRPVRGDDVAAVSLASIRFIEENKDEVVDGRRLGVEPICEVLQVAPSSYYAVRGRPTSARACRDAELTPQLTKIWKDNY